MAINIIFDGPPSPEAGRFVEVENDVGESINAGEWSKRDDGYWQLRITSIPTEQLTAGLAWTEIAASAYRSYAASTGNKNFRGEPMPAFTDLPEPIRVAWQAAVRQVGDILECSRTALENEQEWAGWIPPSA